MKKPALLFLALGMLVAPLAKADDCSELLSMKIDEMRMVPIAWQANDVSVFCAMVTVQAAAKKQIEAILAGDECRLDDTVSPEVLERIRLDVTRAFDGLPQALAACRARKSTARDLAYSILDGVAMFTITDYPGVTSR